MTTPDPALEAAADQAVAETLHRLRALAAATDIDVLPHHQAVAELAARLLATATPQTLANSLANVLLQQVRHEELPPLITS